MVSLKTSLCDLLNIEYPILQAGMGGVAFGPLAAAVSKAGGLGTIAAISPTPERVEQEIKFVRSFTSKPLCVDIGFPLRAPKVPSDVDIPQLPGPIKDLQAEVEGLGVAIKPVDDQAMGVEDAKTKLDICLFCATASRSSPALWGLLNGQSRSATGAEPRRSASSAGHRTPKRQSRPAPTLSWSRGPRAAATPATWAWSPCWRRSSTSPWCRSSPPAGS